MDEIKRIKEKCIERVLDCRYEDDKVGIYIGRAIQDATQHEKQRTKEACFKAGWAWIQDDFGEQFGYDPTDDTDKEDFKQAIDEAKIE